MLVAYIGEAAGAIQFMMLLVAAIVVGSYVFTYAGHSFLVVVEQTATGNDEVVWPDDPYLDWIWRAAALSWLLLVWLAPLGVVLKLTYRNIYTQEPALALLFAGIALWLFFPLGVLSSLYADSAWAFFHPQVLAGLCRVGASTIGFYAATALVVAAGLVPWYFALTRSALLLPVAAVIGSAAVLIHARLLGRLAWIMMGRTGAKRKKKKLLRPQPVATEEAPTTSDQVTGYQMAHDSEEKEGPQIATAAEMLAPLQRRVDRVTEQLAKKVPARSLWGGVYTFPCFDRSMSAWLRLAAGATVLGGLVRLLLPGLG